MRLEILEGATSSSQKKNRGGDRVVRVTLDLTSWISPVAQQRGGPRSYEWRGSGFLLDLVGQCLQSALELLDDGV